MGKGDESAADYAAAEAMHTLFPSVECNAHLVMGEGEQEAIGMLYHGETLGTGKGPDIEVALDALEGATTCAAGGPNVISVMLLLNTVSSVAPHPYMDKMAVGPVGKGVVDLDKPVAENLAALAKAKG
jgi:fructose-1,6-bisphosphatase/sedoheptulose 1,7-bisphosphatase-like protein